MEFKPAIVENGSRSFEVYFNMSPSSFCLLVREFSHSSQEFDVRVFCQWSANQVRRFPDKYPYEENPKTWKVIPKRDLDAIIISYGYEIE